MASGPITSWEIDGETVETVSDFILGGSKITADGDCNHEIKRGLLLGRKVIANLDSILKSRDIALPTKVCLVKVMVLLDVKAMMPDMMLDGITDSMDVSLSELLEMVMDREARRAANHGVTKSRTRLSD